MKIGKEKLLTKLQSVTPGIAEKEVIEQSTTFAFVDGYVYTFNDQIFCKNKCPKELQGAVQAEPFLNILNKLDEKTVEIKYKDDKTHIKGKNKKTALNTNKEVRLPIYDVEAPGKWKDAPENFAKAIRLVSNCYSKDETEFKLTCIHIAPDYIEACDHYQAVKFPIKTPIKMPFLVRGAALQHLKDKKKLKISVTKSWVHFKDENTGAIISCRKWDEEYPNIKDVFAGKGTKIQLPTDIQHSIDRASVFAENLSGDKNITFRLEKNKMQIEADNAYGSYKEAKKTKYTGKEISFVTTPSLLIDIAKRYKKCSVLKTKLKVKTKRYTYVTALESD